MCEKIFDLALGDIIKFDEKQYKLISTEMDYKISHVPREIKIIVEFHEVLKDE